MHPQLRRSALVASTLALLLAVSSCGGGGGGSGGGQRVGTIRGRLAAPPPTAAPSGLSSALAGKALSLAQVSIDLVSVDASVSPTTTTVVASATPDATGAFAFTAVEEGTYGLRVNQPEFATVAYGVDTTELQLVADQTVNVVLPVITTIVHGLVDPYPPTNQAGAPIFPVTALDRDTGEVLLATSVGLAVVDPEHATVDVLRSHDLFDGACRVALPPTRGLLWLLCGERIVRVDRSLFTDPAANEAIDLELLARRVEVGDKVRYRLLDPPAAASSIAFTGKYYFSPDEQTLFAATADGVAVLDLASMAIVDTIPGRLAGYNPTSNQLFFVQPSTGRFSTVAVVDATTRFDVVSPLTVEGFLGVAPWPSDPRTVIVGSQLNTSSVEIPFVTAVNGAGAVVVPWTRASTWLGAATDPAAAPPSFDAAGSYFTLGEAAFRILAGGGFEPLMGGIQPGPAFLQRFAQGCLSARTVDTTNMVRLWYGCADTAASVALISLDRANVPIAVRPSVDATLVMVDEARGRAVFRGTDRLVLVHYADPTATARAEVTDLSPVLAPWVALGAQCNATTPCVGDEVCVAPTATSGSGRCLPNPRLPYRPLCGGFADLPCDAGFTCTYVDDTRHRMGGTCVGLPDRDYATNGPLCGAGDACPSGMSCAAGRCAPKTCLRDADCTGTGEICGLVQNLGRACLVPGPLPDGAHCLDAGECAHGACVPVESGWQQGTGNTLFGYRGLMTCTTPCFEQADCPAGGHCLYQAPDSNPPDAWRSHRVELAPYCSSPVVPPALLACAATCGPAQLCRIPMGASTGACHVGYSPESGAPFPADCLAPAVQNPWLAGCGFRCDRSGDCPWSTSCQEGVCATDDRPGCTSACGAAESCVPAWESPTPGVPFICQALESCFSQADCSAGTCHTDACYVTACTTNADCGAGECVRFPDFTTPPFTRFCATSARCGCTGPEASAGVCDGLTNKCVIERECATAACDGTIAGCSGTTDPSPLACSCAMCAWDTADCGGPAPATCPAGFTCAQVANGHPTRAWPGLGSECDAN